MAHRKAVVGDGESDKHLGDAPASVLRFAALAWSTIALRTRCPGAPELVVLTDAGVILVGLEVQ